MYPMSRDEYCHAGLQNGAVVSQRKNHGVTTGHTFSCPPHSFGDTEKILETLEVTLGVIFCKEILLYCTSNDYIEIYHGGRPTLRVNDLRLGFGVPEGHDQSREVLSIDWFTYDAGRRTG
jgi:hypothetical protein